MSYAGFWKRFAAFLLDQIILWCVGLLLLVPFFGMLGLGIFESAMTDSEPSEGMIAAILGAYFGSLMLIVLAGWLYYALMESSAKQATLGKMALSIVVTDMNGNRISFGRATGRYFGKILSSLIFYIGYIMVAFTEKKQGLHDMIAGCLVVNK
ncbi:MAG TPA: RDD family protein [Bacteroidota bacterium]